MIRNIIKIFCLLIIPTSILSGCAVGVIGAVASTTAIKNQYDHQTNDELEEMAAESNAVDHHSLPNDTSPTNQHAEQQAAVINITQKQIAKTITENHTSIKNLTARSWSIKAVNQTQAQSLTLESTVFSFSNDSKFKAFLSCNYISGKFYADDKGSFLIKNLYASNKPCGGMDRQEALIKATLLSADEFFISDQTLLFGTQGKTSVILAQTDNQIDIEEFKHLKLERKKIRTSITRSKHKSLSTSKEKL